MSPYFSYGFNSNGRQLLCVSHPWTSRPWSLRNGEQSCKGIREVRNVRGLTCLERLLEQAGSWLPVFFPPHFFPPPPSSSPLLSFSPLLPGLPPLSFHSSRSTQQSWLHPALY